MASVTIRVPEKTHLRLRELAEKHGAPIGEVVDEATRRMEEADFWDDVNAAYERLYADPVAKAEYEAEFALWETASLVDFDEPPYEGIEELLAAAQNQEDKA